jgi:hypothetical protein
LLTLSFCACVTDCDTHNGRARRLVMAHEHAAYRQNELLTV